MRLMERNLRTVWYARYLGREPVVDEYGNETGEGRVVYGDPEPLRANVSAATGAAQTEQFGNLADYDRVLLTADPACPADEHSVFWVDRGPAEDGSVAYDYVVRRAARSLNCAAYAVRKVSVS